MSSINGLHLGKSLQALVALVKTKATEKTEETSTAVSSPAGWGRGQAVSFEQSRPGEMLSKLTQVQESDPTRFTQLTAEIAQTLTDAAGSLSGRAAARVTEFAARFERASTSGDLSAFQLPTAPGGNRYVDHPTRNNERAQLLHLLKKLANTDKPSEANTAIDGLWTNILAKINQALAPAEPPAETPPVETPPVEAPPAEAPAETPPVPEAPPADAPPAEESRAEA